MSSEEKLGLLLYCSPEFALTTRSRDKIIRHFRKTTKKRCISSKGLVGAILFQSYHLKVGSLRSLELRYKNKGENKGHWKKPHLRLLLFVSYSYPDW